MSQYLIIAEMMVGTGALVGSAAAWRKGARVERAVGQQNGQGTLAVMLEKTLAGHAQATLDRKILSASIAATQELVTDLHGRIRNIEEEVKGWREI